MTTVATTNPQDVFSTATENPQDVKLSRVPDDMPRPHPEFNGRLIKHPDRPEQYLVVNGYKRHVLDQKTVQSLFITNPTCEAERLIDEIATGPALESGAMTVKGDNADPWYFLPGGGVKMWIRNKNIFAQNQFRAVTVFPQVVISSIPNGPDLQAR